MTYNGAATVERALSTLLAQSYRDYELIISDDHSTDDTLAICQRVAAGHEQVRFIRPERNLGAEFNMKLALSQACGKYYLWACQDDYWHREYLQRLMSVLEHSPSVICAQSWVRWVSNDGTRVMDLRLYGRDLPERQSRLALAVSILTAVSREGNLKGRNNNILKNNIFMHGLWNREAFSVALDAHRKSFTGERQLLCQLALAGDFRYVDEPLFSKTFYDVKLHERRPTTDTTLVVKKNNGGRWRELSDTLAAIVRSPIVSTRIKVIALPVLAAAYYRHRLKGRLLSHKQFSKVFRRILTRPGVGAVK